MAANHTSSLPFELLALIFEHLYHDIGEVNHRFVDFGDPTLFPCAIARVCQLWREVVAQCPEYWKNIVFDVASEEPPFLDAFAWAKKTRFRVLIFDSRYGPYEGCRDSKSGSQMSERRLTTISKTPPSISADQERALVRNITEALLPHLKQCRSLEYNTSFSDSLPEVTTILHPARAMATLRLDYRINNSDISVRALNYNCDGKGKFSDVQHLSIDVVTFILMMQQCPQLSSRLFSRRSPHLKSLEISAYRFDCDHASMATPAIFGVTEFIHHLSRISHPHFHVCLRGLSTAACGRHNNETGITVKKRLKIQTLVAVDLSEDFLYHLFQQTELVGGLISGDFRGRCEFPVNASASQMDELFLRSLPRETNFSPLLTGWAGHALVVVSCPGFDDALLDKLAEAGTSIEDCLAPYLTVLRIEHCDNLSRQALMNFVTKRNDAAKSSRYINELCWVYVDDEDILRHMKHSTQDSGERT